MNILLNHSPRINSAYFYRIGQVQRYVFVDKIDEKDIPTQDIPPPEKSLSISIDRRTTKSIENICADTESVILPTDGLFRVKKTEI